MTVGHNLQFSPEALRMREAVKNGFLGGPPVHLESIQCFSHGDPVYGKVLLGDRTHWVRTLPGSLLHNLISHGIAKIAEFLTTDHPEVIAHAFTSPYLTALGQEEIVDELRVIIHDRGNMTAYFTFSTQFGVAANELRLYGKTNSLIVDNLNRMFVPIRKTGYKSFMRYFLAPLVLARAYSQNSWRNIRQFLRNDFHETASMKNLIQAFYRAVSDNTPAPITYKEILVTSRIMDEIFRQFPSRATSIETSEMRAATTGCELVRLAGPAR
jgi:predicted dehydrogenase